MYVPFLMLASIFAQFTGKTLEVFSILLLAVWLMLYLSLRKGQAITSALNTTSTVRIRAIAIAEIRGDIRLCALRRLASNTCQKEDILRRSLHAKQALPPRISIYSVSCQGVQSYTTRWRCLPLQSSMGRILLSRM